jgi:hypothetical protein
MANFSGYLVVTQLAFYVVYAFTQLDWTFLFQKRKWRWLPKSRSISLRDS